MDTNTKSEQEEKIKSSTPCKECYFCKYENNIQVGCLTGRLEKFREEGEILETRESEGKTYSVIGRLCNYFRLQRWAEKYEDKDLVEIVEKESEPTFALVIDCEDHSPEKLEKTLNDLIELDYNRRKLTIVLHIDGTRDIWQLVHQVNLLKKYFPRVLLISNSQRQKNIKDYDIFSKCANMYFFTTMKIGGDISPDLFNDINHIINYDLKKIAFVETKDTQSVISSVVKDKYLDFNDYEKMLKYVRQFSIDSDMYACIL